MIRLPLTALALLLPVTALAQDRRDLEYREVELDEEADDALGRHDPAKLRHGRAGRVRSLPLPPELFFERIVSVSGRHGGYP